jgi:type IV pilus assembly protein PilE
MSVPLRQCSHAAPVARRMRGVTLIELMIVVVIVAILAGVAYPSYREFTARATRNEAKAALLMIATNQERFYLQNNTYTTDMTQLGFPVADNFQTNSESYNVRVTGADSNNFTATATYLKGGDESLKCNLFQIDGRGIRISDPDTDCWTRTR